MSEEATMTEKAPPASSLTDGASRDLEIRAAGEADLAACCALEHGYTSRYVWQLSARDSSGSPAMRFQRLRLPRPLEVDDAPPRALLAHSLLPPGGMLVAEERRESETRILAYLTLIHERELALTRITRLVTTRPRRGEGIGSALLAAAARQARARIAADETGRAQRLRLETRCTNYPAIQFCRRAGFLFSGYDEQYYADGEIALFFSRPLQDERES